MRARDLAESFPMVRMDTDAMAAVQTMGEHRLPGLIVVDDAGRPHTVLPGSQVLRFVIPSYVQDDPSLARAYSERSSDELWGHLADMTVLDILPRRPDRDELPVVDEDATTLEVAAVMARMHSPLVAVMAGEEIVGVITVSLLLQHLVAGPPAG